MPRNMKTSAAAMTVLSASALTGGCYPLEQASLVYSSKQQMGVNVTAGTPDAPGLDVVIGYKGLDVAMVPVAVAKHCKRDTPDQCVKGNYDIQVISGVRDESTGSDDVQAAMKDLKGLIDGKATLLAEQRGSLAGRKKIIADRQKYYEIQGEIDRVDALRKQTAIDQVDAITGYDNQIALNKESQQDYLYAKDEDVSVLNSTIRDLEKNIGLLATELEQDRLAYGQKLLAVKMKSVGERQDALSVYGTFSGRARGETGGANLSAGKVFATGIAAQFLSETAGIADCLAKLAILAEDVTAGVERSAYVSDTRKLCEIKHRVETH